jgi:hypothetical protein
MHGASRLRGNIGLWGPRSESNPDSRESLAIRNTRKPNPKRVIKHY